MAKNRAERAKKKTESNAPRVTEDWKLDMAGKNNLAAALEYINSTLWIGAEYSHCVKELKAIPGAWEMLRVYEQSVYASHNETVCIDDLDKFLPHMVYGSYSTEDIQSSSDHILSALDYWNIDEFVVSDTSNYLLRYLAAFRCGGWELDGMQVVSHGSYETPGIVLVRVISKEREKKAL